MPTGPSGTDVPTNAGPLAELLINSNVIAVALTDRRRLLFANAAFNRLFGQPQDLVGISLLDLILPGHRDQVAAALAAETEMPPAVVAGAMRGTKTFEVELRFERVRVEGETLLAIFAQEVADHFEGEKERDEVAGSDALTGLGNRAMLAERLRQAELTMRRSARSFALLLLDLDGFGKINDRYGLEAGDFVLRRIAARLLANLRETDTITRLGGDAFAILVTNVTARTNVMATADRLIRLARQPVQVEQFEVRVGGSVGLAICPEHAGTVDGLFAAAELALLAAKRKGRGCAVWASTARVVDVMPVSLTWSAAHETGLREIDEQHATLVALLNELIGALRDGTDHAPALAEVMRYTAFHFASGNVSCGHGPMMAPPRTRKCTASSLRI